MTHLKFIGYNNISEIFEPREIKENRCLETMVSTNVRNMNQDESNIRQMLEGDYPSKIAS